MGSCNDVSASAVTGVTGVTGVWSTSLCKHDPAKLSAVATVSSAGSFGISLSTLSRLNGNRPVAAHPALMFLLFNALSLAGLYR
jgi:hypothetical protein